MNKFTMTSLLLSAVFLGGCNYSHVRVVHASPDAPNVDVHFEKGLPIKNLAFTEGSSYVPVKAGERQVQVKASGTDFVAIDVTPTLMKQTAYTVLAVNNLDQIEPLLLEDDPSYPSADMVKLRVVHASASAPAVDVYVSAPGAALPADPTIDSLSFKDATGYLEVPAGDYQVRVTLDEGTDVVYDSGALPLAGGSNLTVVAVQANEGMSPISLTVLTGDPKNPSLNVMSQ